MTSTVLNLTECRISRCNPAESCYNSGARCIHISQLDRPRIIRKLLQINYYLKINATATDFVPEICWKSQAPCQQ